jgi:hypothetical protein
MQIPHSLTVTQQSVARRCGQKETIMTHIIEARVIGIHAAMGRSTTTATDRPHLTIHEVLRAGIRRAALRKDMAAALSRWDSEGGVSGTGV